MKDKVLKFAKFNSKARYKNQEISSIALRQTIHVALLHHISFLS